MGKKKNAGNGYYPFVLHYQRMNNCSRLEAEQKCSEIWPQLPEAQRQRYKDDGKAAFAELGPRKVLDSLGKVAETLEEQQLKVEIEQRAVTNYVVRTMGLEGKDPSASSHFGVKVNNDLVVMHVNLHCETNEGRVVPAEIAAVRFTIADGIIDTFHRILHHDSLPNGYKFQANEHAKNTHNIDYAIESGEPDFDRVGKDLLAFLMGGYADDRGISPVFTLETEKETTVKALNLLAEEVGDGFRVWDLAIAFSLVANAAFEGEEGSSDRHRDLAFTTASATHALEKDVFLFKTAVADCCPFHGPLDNVEHCSLAIAKRRVFTVLSQVSKFCGITLVPGKHVPSKAPMYRPVFEDEGAGTGAVLKEHINPFGTEVARCGTKGGHTKLPQDDPAPIIARAVRENEEKSSSSNCDWRRGKEEDVASVLSTQFFSELSTDGAYGSVADD